MLSIRQVHINNTSHTNGGIEHILHSSSSLSSMTMTDDTIKEHHQHQHQQHIHYDDRHPLPTTVSMDISDRSGGSSTTISSTQSDISDISPYPLSLSTVAPITGQLSNILDDYIVFPTIIGEGSFGCVRECFARRSSTSSNMLYAVKSIEKSKVKRLNPIRREINILSNMNHNHIMKMVTCYEDVDYIHIITERYMGGDLFDRVRNCTTMNGCFAESRAASIIKSLLEAVAYLNENDIVHRDIKPENILFQDENDDTVKLIDFGFARRHTDDDPPMSSPIGTSYYVSPEILKCRYDKSSCDVWAVGTIAYIMLCGLPPFNGETDEDIFEDIKLGYLLFLPVAAWQDKSNEARDFINCLLNKDIRNRICSAKEALMHPWIVNLGG